MLLELLLTEAKVLLLADAKVLLLADAKVLLELLEIAGEVS